MIHGAGDYALARLHARMASAMRGEDWRRLGSARGTVAVLALLRTSAAERWATGLSGGEDPHRIEASLRERFRERTGEIARWADPCWQAALAWCGQLVDLNPTDGEGDPAAAWLAELQRRVPPLFRNRRHEIPTLLPNTTLFRYSGGEDAHRIEASLREDLQRRLATRMGRNRLCVAHLLTAVALLWLEYERVRGELLRWAALQGAAA